MNILLQKYKLKIKDKGSRNLLLTKTDKMGIVAEYGGSYADQLEAKTGLK